MFGLIFLEHYISLLHLEPMYSRNISHSLTQWFCLTCDPMLSTILFGNLAQTYSLVLILGEQCSLPRDLFHHITEKRKHLLQAYYSTGKALATSVLLSGL
uniref:Uncharacterized protein n=1 Tax=Cacopsylla melanoneura TaxID=428564 RepID=A0A8D9BNH5_9HEMI